MNGIATNCYVFGHRIWLEGGTNVHKETLEYFVQTGQRPLISIKEAADGKEDAVSRVRDGNGDSGDAKARG